MTYHAFLDLPAPDVVREQLLGAGITDEDTVKWVCNAALVAGELRDEGQAPDDLGPEMHGWISRAHSILSTILDPDTGVAFPWPAINELFGDVLPGDVVVVGALPGAGKSTFARNTLDYCAHVIQPTLYLGLEQPPEETIRDLVSMRLDLNPAKVAAGRWDDLRAGASEQYAKAVIDVISDDYPMMITPDRFLTPDLMANRLEALDWRPKMVIIDHLHRLQGSKNYFEAVEATMRGLREAALQYRVVVLVLAQCGRRKGMDVLSRLCSPSQMDDIEGGGRIEQEATHVAILRRPVRPDITKGERAQYRQGQLSAWHFVEKGITRVDLVKRRRGGVVVGEDSTRLRVLRNGRMLEEDETGPTPVWATDPWAQTVEDHYDI